jgi:hypothetical protein
VDLNIDHVLNPKLHTIKKHTSFSLNLLRCLGW